MPSKKTRQPAKPPVLKKGDRVGLVCPSGRPASPGILNNCIRIVEDMGFSPVVGSNVMNIDGCMAGTAEERLSDFMGFIQDRTISGLFCVTGGFGSLYLLPLIDYELISKNPKVIVGCDDNTLLVNAICSRSRMVTFLGPNLDGIRSRETFNNFVETLTSDRRMRRISCAHGLRTDSSFEYNWAPVPGTVQGKLAGGNLTAYLSLMGTPFEPDLTERILILEDKNERNDIVERWFTSLFLSGNLMRAAGVAFGKFENCSTRGEFNMFSIEELLGDRLKEMEKISSFGFPFGQSDYMATVPLGVHASLDAAGGTMDILDTVLA